MRADLAQLRLVLIDVRAARRADRGLDAGVMLALGWEVRRGAEPRHPAAWRVRSPLARMWVRLPEISRCPLAAYALLPAGWEWSVARDRRGGGAAHADNGEPQSISAGAGAPNPRRLAFDARAATPGLAALTVTLRALLALSEAGVGGQASGVRSEAA